MGFNIQKNTFNAGPALIALRNLVFRLMLFNGNEIATISLAIQSKRKKEALWYGNNLIAPLLIIYSPYLLYLVSKDFEVIQFDRGFFELSITGAITLLGINVMRISLTLINEKIDESKIPENIRRGIIEDVESLKSKLRHWINTMTILGAFLFLIQAAGFIKSDNTNTIYYIIGVFFLSIISIILGRFITIVQSNFFDNENLVKNWIDALGKKTEDDYKELTGESKNGGLS